MPTVYVVNRAGHDHSAAEKFGNVRFLTEGFIDRMDTAQMYREMSEAINDSKPDDYLILTSLSTLCSIAAGMFAYKHGRLNILLWNKGEYLPRVHMMGDLIDIEDDYPDSN